MAVDRVAFMIGSLPVYWYGIVIGAGVVLSVILASLRERRAQLPSDTALDFILVALPAALVFARAYYVAFEWDQFAGDWRRIVDVRSGGMAIYGGLIGGALAAIFVAKWKKIRYGTLADLVAPSLALGQGIGRWGNFFNQEAYGFAVESARWQFFPASVYIEADGMWHLATFFYESVWCIGIWLVLEILVRRGVFDKKRPGDVFSWYAIAYCAERALVEGLRTDSLYWGSVRVSQAGSLIGMLIILVWFFVRVYNRNRAAAPFAVGIGAAGVSLAQAMGVLPANVWLMLVCNVLALGMGIALYRFVPDAAKEEGDLG